MFGDSKPTHPAPAQPLPCPCDKAAAPAPPGRRVVLLDGVDATPRPAVGVSPVRLQLQRSFGAPALGHLPPPPGLEGLPLRAPPGLEWEAAPAPYLVFCGFEPGREPRGLFPAPAACQRAHVHFARWLFSLKDVPAAGGITLVVTGREAKACLQAIKAARTMDEENLRLDTKRPTLDAPLDAVSYVVIVAERERDAQKAREFIESEPSAFGGIAFREVFGAGDAAMSPATLYSSASPPLCCDDGSTRASSRVASKGSAPTGAPATASASSVIDVDYFSSGMEFISL